MVHVRAATTDEADVRFLREMLYEAFAWRSGDARPAFDALLMNPKAIGYVEGWCRVGDYGVIAEADSGTPLGAAWHRLFSEDAPGYGFISTTVPEITIGVASAARRHGIGTSLLAALIDHARHAGLPALSLSVEEDNPAVRLYERLGFKRVGRVENALTMRLDLDPAVTQ
jgi:ribosomal protein S18 acetylase RimI-like enzyme